VYDPVVDATMVKNSFDVEILTIENLADNYDAIILAVPHQQVLSSINFEYYKNARAFIYDVKGVLEADQVDSRL
jgi:UDP-N-acetyl-D-galactosamine dehydrogenase